MHVFYNRFKSLILGETKEDVSESNTSNIIFIVLGLGVVAGVIIGFLKWKKSRTPTYKQATQVDTEMVDMKKNVDIEAPSVKMISETTPLTAVGNGTGNVTHENERQVAEAVEDFTAEEIKEPKKNEIKYIDEHDDAVQC